MRIREELRLQALEALRIVLRERVEPDERTAMTALRQKLWRKSNLSHAEARKAAQFAKDLDWLKEGEPPVPPTLEEACRLHSIRSELGRMRPSDFLPFA